MSTTTKPSTATPKPGAAELIGRLHAVLEDIERFLGAKVDVTVRPRSADLSGQALDAYDQPLLDPQEPQP